MIYDCHSHIASSKILPPQWYKGWMDHTIEALPGKSVEVEKQYVEHLFQYLNHDDSCDRMIKQMDEAGIDKSTLLIIDWGLTYDDYEHSLEDVYQSHYELLKAHPDRFWVFAGVDPRRGQAGLDLFERSIKECGFSGLKLYPPCGYSPSDESLFPFYEICAEHNLPVLTHIGPSAPSLRARFAMPIEVDTAAWQFPKVNFILGHGAVTYPYECGLLAAHRSNIYLDMSGFQTLSDEELEANMKSHLRQNLHKKILFGTDWPIHFFAGHQKSVLVRLEKLFTNGLVDEDTKALIMYKNYERLMS